MAANMYRVGGMYVNVDLFLIKLKPLQFISIPTDSKLTLENAAFSDPVRVQCSRRAEPRRVKLR